MDRENGLSAYQRGTLVPLCPGKARQWGTEEGDWVVTEMNRGEQGKAPCLLTFLTGG